MAAKVRQHYFGDRPIDGHTLYEYSTLFGDVFFTYGIQLAVRLQAAASTGRTFFYRFSVDGRLNEYKLATLAGQLQFPGATHADDKFYLFGYLSRIFLNSNRVSINFVKFK